MISFTFPYNTSSSKVVRAGDWREAGADAEAMEDSYLLIMFMACSACCLTEPGATRSGLGPPTMSWALPHQSLIKKMPYRLAYKFD